MKKRVIGSILVSILLIIISYYLYLPALNFQSVDMWLFIIVHLSIFVAINKVWLKFDQSRSTVIQGLMFAVFVILAIFIIASVLGSTFFNSKTYASQITLEEAVFEEDFVEAENISNIALMDTSSAVIIGNRTLGTLSDLVSQFEVSDKYTQINYESRPMKISPLNYSGIIKYFKNDGIPGYVLVDPVNNTAEFIRLEEKIQYSDSAYLGKNLNRKLRFQYPTLLFGEKHFEIDEKGKPYWVCQVLEANASLFGAKNIASVVVLDAVTGDSVNYEIDEIPSWIDYVYSGAKISELYNWYGAYQSGFWNSILGQEGCTSTTEDYGYKVIDDDVYVFTGITSLTAEDESNIGFIMVNARTGEFRYYTVSGAEEYSAMSAAEGEVQQYKYAASFPSLINVSGEPTYLMVLKDDNNIVKLYAMVNMKNYNIVVTGSSQEETLAEYKKALVKSLPDVELSEDDVKTSTIVIAQINFVVVDGETICYIKDSANNFYKTPFKEKLILLGVGSEITIQYTEFEVIRELISIE